MSEDSRKDERPRRSGGPQGRAGGGESRSSGGRSAGSGSGSHSGSGRTGDSSRSSNAARGGSGASASGRSGSAGERSSSSSRSPRAGGASRSTGDRARRDSDQRLWTRDGKPARGDRDARDLTDDHSGVDTRSVRPHHEDPPIPDDVTEKSLDRAARNELKTLTAENQEFVARHLAMAARLIDEDPELAHQHALSASRRGGRIGMVRESLAITAYATGDFALALRELRTFRRLTGRDDQLPMMVDSERGLGRPDRALELGRSVPRASLPVPVQVELAIAMSGARLDLGQPERALEELTIPQLDPTKAFSWSPQLFAAYATVLEDLGRGAEAAAWHARAERAEEVLDAAVDADAFDTVQIVDVELDGDALTSSSEAVGSSTSGSISAADE